MKMSECNIEELNKSLEKNNWKIIEDIPGNDYGISLSWKIQRSNQEEPTIIDFEGFDDLITLPIEKSYGCNIRGKNIMLYFRKLRSKSIWNQELENFINQT
jgi:hypothetical protein